VIQRKNVYWFFGGLCALAYGYLGLLYFNESSELHNHSLCFVKNVFNVACPSCGISRGLLLLVSGEFEAAFLMNPLSYLLGLSLVILPIWLSWDTLRRQNSLWKSYQLMVKLIETKKVAIICTAVIGLNWIWTISKGI